MARRPRPSPSRGGCRRSAPDRQSLAARRRGRPRRRYRRADRRHRPHHGRYGRDPAGARPSPARSPPCPGAASSPSRRASTATISTCSRAGRRLPPPWRCCALARRRAAAASRAGLGWAPAADALRFELLPVAGPAGQRSAGAWCSAFCRSGSRTASAWRRSRTGRSPGPSRPAASGWSGPRCARSRSRTAAWWRRCAGRAARSSAAFGGIVLCIGPDRDPTRHPWSATSSPRAWRGSTRSASASTSTRAAGSSTGTDGRRRAPSPSAR